MQLDRTRIVIRERSLLEIFDLSLHIARDGGMRLVAALVLGIAPFMAINFLLLNPLLQAEDFTSATAMRYGWLMLQLVFLEAQLATAPATLLLGNVMFLEPISLRKIFGQLGKLSGRLFFCQGILRGILPGWGLCLMLSVEELGPADFFLSMLCAVVMFARALRPYLNEIILLEQNPLRSRNKQTISIASRSSSLQNPNSGELFGAWMLSVALGAPLGVSFALTIWAILGMFVHEWSWGAAMRLGGVPVAMWAVASLFCVIRFLSYIDLRIRREGWAVELQLRAEAGRLASELS